MILGVNENSNTVLSEIFEHDFVHLTRSGTYAIIIALHAANLPEGSKVIMPAICCPAVLSAIQMAGYNPIIADVNPHSLCMEVDNIKDVYSPQCSAVIAIHSYGRPCDLPQITDFCKSNRLFLIEDACLGYGFVGQAGMLGSGGDIAVLSFGYDKPLNCGGGGALMTSEATLATGIRNMINENPFLAMLETHQEILLKSINDLQDNVKKRIENSNQYFDLLKANCLRMPEKNIAYWRLPLVVECHRDELIDTALKEGLVITKHYRSLGGLATNSKTPVANKIDENIINLFTHSGVSNDYINNVSTLIKAFYNDRST
jgi:dTDP-4-amino-4,6-dideoxygalactose transaminase